MKKHIKMRSLVLAFLSAVVLTASPLPIMADTGTGSVTFGWAQTSDSRVAGYRIYYGTTPGKYTSTIMVGNIMKATVTGLVPGITYYFAAVSYAADGKESEFTDEVSYTVPLVVDAVVKALTASSGQFSLTVSGAADKSYIVEASSNLVDWIPVWTNASPFTYTDIDAGTFSQRFYRTK